MTQDNLKMYVFFCSNSIDAGYLNNECGKLNGGNIKTISLPCSGKIDIPYLLKAFETGADGAVIVTCKLSECRHLEGNMRAHKRAEAVESLLKEIGLDGQRMAVISVKDPNDSGRQVLGEIKDFFNKVSKLPSGIADSTRESIAK